MKKRRLFLILAAALLVAAAVAAALILGGERDALEDGSGSSVELVYYTIGDPDEDLELVNQAINELLLERYGFTIDYRKLGWNEYEAYLTSLVNTHSGFDIAFTWTEGYQENAVAGHWLDITDFLSTEDFQGLRSAVDERFWHGAAVGGRVYGVPTNKELATPLHFLYSAELVEKYGVDIESYDSIASLEGVLEEVAAGESGCIPLFFDSSHVNLVATLGYEYAAYSDLPLVVRSGDSSCAVLNAFEQPDVLQLLDTLRRYYLLGYINQDAAIRSNLSRFDDERVFLRIASGGPDSAASYSQTFGYPIVVHQSSESIVTSESTQGGIMAVNAYTAHPRECLVFLQALNTDPELRNLFNYGIEGVHYTLTDSGQVHSISGGYTGVEYTQGNWFILRTREGERPDKWDVYREFNDEARESELLGFSPSYDGLESQRQAVADLYQRYGSALFTGTVDPEIYVPRFLEELEAAGLGELQSALQSQIDAFLTENKGDAVE